MGYASIAARFREDPLCQKDMIALGNDEENMKMYDLWAEERAEAMTLTRDQRIEEGFGHWHMPTNQTGGRGTVNRSWHFYEWQMGHWLVRGVSPERSL